MNRFSSFWDDFSKKNPNKAKWIREVGMFNLVSFFISLSKYLVLQFLPKAFSNLPLIDFGFPGITVTIFGETFKWNIIGYDVNHGGLPYFVSYMIAMVTFEIVNFFLQRSFVFKSKGNILHEGMWYLLAFILVTIIVNSINCIWISVMGNYVSSGIYNIGTILINGLISMIVFFYVNKKIFK